VRPIQPIKEYRFEENKIVTYLLDNGPFDMNDIASLDFSNEDREQFAQLIGYSLGGFSELGYVSDETYETACKIADEGKTEDQARIEHLQSKLTELERIIKQLAVAMYNIHPDNLTP